MRQDENRLRDALKTIAELAISAGTSHPGADPDPYDVHPTDGERAQRQVLLHTEGATRQAGGESGGRRDERFNPVNAPALLDHILGSVKTER